MRDKHDVQTGVKLDFVSIPEQELRTEDHLYLLLYYLELKNND